MSGYQIERVIKEIGLGINNDQRPKLQRLLADFSVKRIVVERIVVERKENDRHIFATHYHHESTELAKMRPGAQNYQMAVSEAS